MSATPTGAAEGIAGLRPDQRSTGLCIRTERSWTVPIQGALGLAQHKARQAEP